jgi:hypothetical protein
MAWFLVQNNVKLMLLAVNLALALQRELDLKGLNLKLVLQVRTRESRLFSCSHGF